jgi:hypothetical protein
VKTPEEWATLCELGSPDRSDREFIAWCFRGAVAEAVAEERESIARTVEERCFCVFDHIKCFTHKLAEVIRARGKK